MKCFYCGKNAVGMKATGTLSSSPVCFRCLCNGCWKKVRAGYVDEQNGDFDAE